MGLLLPLFAVIEISPDAMVGVAQLRPAGGVMVAEETEKPAGMVTLAEPKLFPAYKLVIVTVYGWFAPVRNVTGLIPALNERGP